MCSQKFQGPVIQSIVNLMKWLVKDLLSLTVLINIIVGCIAQSVGHLTHKSGVLGSIPCLTAYLRFSFRFFKKSSCQLLAKVCARSTG